MIKTTGFLLAGAVLGGAAAYLVMDRDGNAGALAVYGAAAAIDDIATLDALIERALAEAPSSARDFELDALLTRLATLDAERAARLAESRQLGDRFVAAAYRDWGAADAGAALRALAAIEPAAARRAAALALLDVVGDDAEGAARVAAALPAAERPSFRADWLAQRARYDPEGAFREMLGLSSNILKKMTAERVGAAWAARDPERALAEARLLSEDVAADYRRSVLTEWARLDAGAVLAYLETATPGPLELVGAMGFLASGDPEQVLSAAERMPEPHDRLLKSSALGLLAERDTQAALDRIEAMQPGVERDGLVSSVAILYALEDPDAAMSWVEKMMPASPDARLIVAMGLAERDPVQALDMLSKGTAEMQALGGLIPMVAAQESSRAKSLAEALADRNDTQGRGLLANLMSNWMQLDAEAALAWILERPSDLDAGVLGNAAATLANRDLALAASYLERIPPAYRDVWITRMAGSHARNDLDGALNWIAQFQGRAVYEQAYGQLVSQAAQANPERAARLLTSASGEVQRGAASAVAMSWARQDPDAAARWALTLGDTNAREQALGSVTRMLAQRSPEEARALLDARVRDPDMRQRIAEQAGL